MTDVVTKLPQALENPIDVWLSRAAIKMTPAVLGAGFTANHVTVCSALATAGSLYALSKNKPVLAASLWALNYFCDILDGILARSHSLGGRETELGGLMDWTTDVIGYASVFVICALRGIRPVWWFALLLTLMASLHMSCQEKVVASNGHLPITGLAYLPWSCQRKEDIYFTRWLGVGTANLAILCMIHTYASVVKASSAASAIV